MRIVPLVLAALLLTGCPATPLAEPPAAANTGLDRSAEVAESLRPLVQVKGEPDQRHGLAERMVRFRTPGVSVAVALQGKLAWAKGFGVVEQGKPISVAPATLFQAASISKAITATATLRLAENKTFSLDEDVNHYLTSWQVPENEFTATEKVTLRRLMSHSAGINQHGFRGYANGDELPSVLQILEGKPPANSAAIRVTAVPGSTLGDSGGGVLIEQLLLTDVTKKPFPELMRELVLVPAGMRESTFEQPLSLQAAHDAASAHDESGSPLRGRFVVYPEMAAAGLWSTPTDLLSWAMAITDARAGRPLAVLSQASARAMLTPQKGPLGLGPIVQGEGRAMRFGHAGRAEGAHAEVVYYPELEMGAAVMVNGASGRPLVREILYAIAAAYDWPDFAPDVVEPVSVDPRTRDALLGRYAATVEGARVDALVRRDGERLILESKRLAVSSELVFVSATSFIVRDSGDAYTFTLGPEGPVDALDWGGIVLPREKR